MNNRAVNHWPAAERPPEVRRVLTLTDMIRVPFSRLPLVAAMTAVGLLGALGYLLLVPTTVRASAVVAVRPVVTDAFTTPGVAADRSINMNVESGIATSTEVVQKLVAAGGGDQREVRNSLTIEVPAGGQILRFVYVAGNADQAVRMVNLAAETYLDTRRAMYEKQRVGLLESYDRSIAEVTQQRAKVQRRVEESSTRNEAALAELTSMNNQLIQLNTARTEIASIDVTPGWVTQAAERELVRDARSWPLFVAIGLFGGALIGVLASYLREATDRRIRSAAEAQDVTGLPLIGTVRQRNFRVTAHAVDADVRYVAMAIAARLGEPIPKPVVLISARGQEDTTVLTASLAVALAADGRDVYVGDDSGRLDRLREGLMFDRQRVPTPMAPATVPSVPQTPPVPPSTGGAGAAGPGQLAGPLAGSPPAGNVPGGEQSGRGATGIAAVPRRKPSPWPVTPPGGDLDATVTLPRLDSGDGASATGTVTVPVRMVSTDTIAVGTGSVRIGPYQPSAGSDILLFNAPPAEADERGVREARLGTAIVVVARNHSRVLELRRLVERLLMAGVQPVGFVLTRAGRD
jgi:capsular polysaccharide biosynthesis protein